MLAFSLAIGNDFIAADHKLRRPADVMNLALRYLGT